MLGRARIAVKILAPVVGLSLLVALVIVTAIRLQATVAEANRKADALSAEVIEASEVRALSRAIQRDALKMTIDLWISANRSTRAVDSCSKGPVG
jgi:hypothetical protein